MGGDAFLLLCFFLCFFCLGGVAFALSFGGVAVCPSPVWWYCLPSPPLGVAAFSISSVGWCCLVSFFLLFLLLFGGAAFQPLQWVVVRFPMSSVGWCCLVSSSFLFGGFAVLPPPFGGVAFLRLPWVGRRSPSLLLGGAAWFPPSLGGVAFLLLLGAAFLLLARQRERERPWPLPLPALPTIWRRGHTFVDSASGRMCARCHYPERATRGRCHGAAGAGVRDAAQRLRLDGSAGHRFVDLLQGGKVVSVICVVCGSYGGRVVRKSLLDKCPGTPPRGRRLALLDVLLGLLLGSKRTARQCSWRNLACLDWTMSHQEPISRVFCPASFCCSSAA